MCLISRGERKILRRFMKVTDVKTDDESTILKRYASIGFVTFDFDFDRMVERAKLTKLGIIHLNR